MASAEIDFKKEYLPGYTGHVPKKMEVFGVTAGDANRIIIAHSRKSSISGDQANSSVGYLTRGDIEHAKRTLYSVVPGQDLKNEELQFGNISRKGANWIGGPTSNIK